MARTSISPRCKPGDLAVFIGGLNLGKLVHIERPFTGEEVIAGTRFCKTPNAFRAWVVTSLSSPLVSKFTDGTVNPKRHFVAAFDEDCLRPLRNPRGTDPTLRWAAKPTQFGASTTTPGADHEFDQTTRL